ncbi:MAG: MATE family efflux transporter [Ignisphaera sp.]
MPRLNKLLVARIIDAVLVLATALIASTEAGFIIDLSVLTSVILLPLATVTILAVLKHGEFSKYTKLAALVSLVAGTLPATYHATTLRPRRAFREMTMSLLAFVERFLFALGNNIHAGIISRLGDAVMVAHNVGLRIESLIYMPGFAFSMTASALVGR